MKDLFHNVVIDQSFYNISTTSALLSSVIDMAGFESLTCAVDLAASSSGATSGAVTYYLLGSDTSGVTAASTVVASSSETGSVLGTIAYFSTAVSAGVGSSKSFGYIGQEYQYLAIAVASASTAQKNVTLTSIKGDARNKPATT